MASAAASRRKSAARRSAAAAALCAAPAHAPKLENIIQRQHQRRARERLHKATSRPDQRSIRALHDPLRSSTHKYSQPSVLSPVPSLQFSFSCRRRFSPSRSVYLRSAATCATAIKHAAGGPLHGQALHAFCCAYADVLLQWVAPKAGAEADRAIDIAQSAVALL